MIQPHSATIKPCECDIASLQTCEYLHDTLLGLLVDEKAVQAGGVNRLLIWPYLKLTFKEVSVIGL